MVAQKRTTSPKTQTNRPTAKTPDERENQLIDAAVDLAEKQIRSGEASAQVITHFLKLGSSRERKEQARLENEILLMEKKREHLESEMRTEALILDALQAMRSYSGVEDPEEEPEYDDREG
jgi:hypothetical protein